MKNENLILLMVITLITTIMFFIAMDEKSFVNTFLLALLILISLILITPKKILKEKF